MKYLFLLLSVNIVFAQVLSSSLDKHKVEIGEPFTIKISMMNLQGKKVFPVHDKIVLPFDFKEFKDDVEQTPEQYLRTVEMGVFQEGQFSIPSMEFRVGSRLYKTIPYEIEVYNPSRQGEKINDIMPNEEVELEWSDYWTLYKNGVFFAFTIIVGAILLLMFFKKKKRSCESPVPSNTVLNDLMLLKDKKYIENEEYRDFYMEFLEIIRNFLEVRYHIPAKILLTDDLIESIKKTSSISFENRNMLEAIFTRGDLVKFAKTFPDQSLVQKDFNQIEDWIKHSLKSV